MVQLQPAQRIKSIGQIPSPPGRAALKPRRSTYSKPGQTRTRHHEDLKMSAEYKRKAVIRLNISTEEERQKFMCAILPEFLRVVDPRQSGLLDVFYASEVINDSDNSSLSGKDVMTRKDQARKLFILLYKLPVGQFLEKVAPELCEMFPHMIPQRFRAVDQSENMAADGTERPEEEEDVCLLHRLQQRVRPATMADMLFHEELLTLEEYSAITEDARKKKDVWFRMLEKFQNRPDPVLQQLQKVTEALLKRYFIDSPGNVSDLVRRGLPCTCTESQTPPEFSSLAFEGKVQSWLDNGKLSAPKALDSVHPHHPSLGFVRNVILPTDDVISVSKTPSFRASSTGSLSADSDSEAESGLAETAQSCNGMEDCSEFSAGSSAGPSAEAPRRKRKAEESNEETAHEKEQLEQQTLMLAPTQRKLKRRAKKDGCLIS
ncbi:hypothetical protein BaRGS_00028535 [Batillaria attramentaria]|uniref:Uncharacterized protein n=1 Tax=Batillaria attramentaria TaxID=370345 RepID=A0ABD0JZ24_9CAEN